MRLLYKIIILSGILIHGIGKWGLSQPKFDKAIHFDKKNGLPDNRVKWVAKGKQGFIWIGTSEGLSRFDGIHFKNYQHDPEDPGSLIDNRINMVLPTEDRIWIGTQLGLSYLDLNSDKMVNYQINHQGKMKNLDRNYLTWAYVLLEDKDGQIWIGTRSVGICRYRPETDDFQFYNAPQADGSTTRHNSVIRMIASRVNDSLIYAGTGEGLIELNRITGKQKLYKFERADKILENNLNIFRRIYQHTDGLIYYGSWGSGIFVLDPKDGSVNTLEVKKGPIQELNVSSIVDIKQKSEEELWISNSYGLMVYDISKKELSVHKKENPRKKILYRGIECIDDQNRAWGFNPYGLDLFDPMMQQFTFHSYADLNEGVWGFAFYILENPEQELVSVLPRSADGLFHFDKKSQTWTKTIIPPQFRSENDMLEGRGFAMDPTGNYTLSTKEGLFTYNFKTNSITPFVYNPSIREKEFSEIIWDAAGNLWLCAGQTGLIRYNPKTKEIRNFKKDLEPGDPPIMGRLISKIFMDSRNRVWVRRTNGVSVFLPDQDSMLNILEPIIGEKMFSYVHTITEDKIGRIWLLASRAKLGFINPDEPEKGMVQILDLSDKMTSGEIRKIAADPKGNIWGYGKKQLFKINVEDLSVSFFQLKYGAEDLDAYSFRFLDSGELVFGTRNGIILANPNDLKRNEELPKPYLSEINVMGKPLKGDTAISKKQVLDLKHWENFLSFEFSAQSFTLGNLTKFQYRLKNFDDWQDANERRHANYTNVPSGEYIFQIKAANNEGIWNEEIFELPVIIATPWWAAWWFRLFAILALVYLGYRIYQYRIRQIREKERLKTEFEKKIANVEMTALLAQMNPHFLFNCLNSIDSYIIKNDSKKASEYLNNFARLIRLILQNSRSNYVSLKDELETLELYMLMESLRFRDKFQYQINIAEDIDVSNIDIPPMLIQPYIENAIWHGLMHKKNKKEGKVELSVSRQNGRLHFNIEDNGIGREAAKAIKQKHPNRGKKSMGTQITQDRIEMINKLYNLETSVATFDLENEQGEASGTRVELIIPI